MITKLFKASKRKMAFLLTLVLALTFLMPSFSNAQSIDLKDAEKQFAENMKKADEIMINVQQERQKSLAAVKTAKGLSGELGVDEKKAIIEKGDKKLKENGFEVYTVNQNNRKELEKQLKMNFDSFFNLKAKDAVSPENFTIYVAKNVKGNEKANVATTDDYTFETYPWDWQSVYVYASDDPAMAKTGYKNIYSKYHSFPYSQSLVTILNRSFNLIVGYTTRYTWGILTALGIDISSIGSTPNESFDIRANAAWTRKYIQIWSVYDQTWLNGSCTEYTNWDTYEYLTYYNTVENRVLTDSNTESGTTYATHWNDYSWLIDQAKIGFWYSYIVWDITGDHKVDYNGTTEITLSENF